jgi:hypothetical protein
MVIRQIYIKKQKIQNQQLNVFLKKRKVKNMPYGKGTYGNKVGRPSNKIKKKKNKKKNK